MANARRMSGNRPIWVTLLVFGIAAAGAYLKQQDKPANAPAPAPPTNSRVETPKSSTPAPSSAVDNFKLLKAIQNRSSDVIVTGSGRIEKLLPDDNDGAKHQRMIVRLPSGESVLIAHNIDLAPRAIAREGDGIEFKGEYIWNDRGGVVHWTHHDPAKRHPEGWIRVNGKTFE